MNKMIQLWTVFLDLLFPRNAYDLLCDSLKPDTLERLITSEPHSQFPECVLPLPYKHTLVKGAIYATKYNGHKRAPVILAQAIAPTVLEELAEQRLFGAFHTPLLVPIPLHPNRIQERGFNQSERIASALYDALADTNITLDTKRITRRKNTTPQAQSATREIRRKNMEHAFLVQNPNGVYGKDILLLDDVLTTGATLMEAKKTLLNAGASRVLCIAVAH